MKSSPESTISTVKSGCAETNVQSPHLPVGRSTDLTPKSAIPLVTRTRICPPTDTTLTRPVSAIFLKAHPAIRLVPVTVATVGGTAVGGPGSGCQAASTHNSA